MQVQVKNSTVPTSISSVPSSDCVSPCAAGLNSTAALAPAWMSINQPPMCSDACGSITANPNARPSISSPAAAAAQPSAPPCGSVTCSGCACTVSQASTIASTMRTIGGAQRSGVNDVIAVAGK